MPIDVDEYLSIKGSRPFSRQIMINRNIMWFCVFVYILPFILQLYMVADMCGLRSYSFQSSSIFCVTLTNQGSMQYIIHLLSSSSSTAYCKMTTSLSKVGVLMWISCASRYSGPGFGYISQTPDWNVQLAINISLRSQWMKRVTKTCLGCLNVLRTEMNNFLFKIKIRQICP